VIAEPDRFGDVLNLVNNNLRRDQGMRKATCITAVLLLIIGMAHAQSVVINEIGWMGTSISEDEWIELYNDSGNAVDLTGWTLTATDGAPNITLSGTISAHGFYLLERTDDTTIADVAAQLIYSGSLGNSGEYLQLWDVQHTQIDEVDCHVTGWFAGSNTTKSSMERKNPDAGGNLAESWATNSGTIHNGTDAGGLPVMGTPGSENSVFDSSLPVELSLFSAQWLNARVRLLWCTASQLNNCGFKVWRADSEAGDYQCISALIPGAGTTSERVSYEYFDERCKTDRLLWYKLEQLDLNGEHKYFGPISVYAGDEDPTLPGEENLLAFPNPFNPGVNLQLILEQAAAVRVEVFDLLGKRVRVLAQDLLLPTGMSTLHWDGRQENGDVVPAGIYFISARTGETGFRTVKVMKAN
jgi:hypothetical protein